MSQIEVFAEKLIPNIEKVIVGKRSSVELAVIGMLCQGHILIEDVPGLYLARQHSLADVEGAPG